MTSDIVDYIIKKINQIYQKLKTDPTIRGLSKVLMTWAMFRSVLFLFVYCVGELLPERHPNRHKVWQAFSDNQFLNSFARWDSGWYKDIVENGYSLHRGESNVVFFPGFPMLTKELAPFFSSHWIAGIILSNISFVLGLCALYLLTRRELSESAAHRAVRYALVFPSTWFFSAYYTEGLFFFLATTALLSYRYERFFLAGLFGFFASLTRTTGILLAPAIFIGTIRRYRFQLKKMGVRKLLSLLWLLLIPLGIGLFSYYLDKEFGDPLAFVHSQAAWGRDKFVWPWMTVINEIILDQGEFYRYIEAWTGALLLALCIVSVKYLDIGLAIFFILLVFMPLSTGQSMSMLRYAATMIPIYLLMAKFSERSDIDRIIMYIFTLFAALTTARFSLWYWAG